MSNSIDNTRHTTIHAPPPAYALFDPLVAQARWLPQYQSEIPKAKTRLKTHEKHGTRVKLRRTNGAARLKVKSVKEMSRQKAKSTKPS